MKNPGNPSSPGPVSILLLVVQLAVCARSFSGDFEGSISAIEGRPGAMAGLLYTVDTNELRIAQTQTNYPSPIDVVNLSSGQVTLIQPMNNTFVRFTPGIQTPPPPHAYHPPVDAQAEPPPAPAGIGPTNFPGMPPLPDMPMPPAGLPPGIGPQTQAGSVPAMPGPPAGTPQMPMMTQMRIPPGAGLELKPTGATTNLFGYTCELYEIARGDQVMEIWATEELLPFQGYLATQPRRFAPPMIEEQWARLVAAKKIFPLSAVLQTREGVEQYRFEVQSITPHQLTTAERSSFEPPENYVELLPRPF